MIPVKQKYRAIHLDKWMLLKRTETCDETLLTDDFPDLLNSLCNKLNNGRCSEEDAIKEFFEYKKEEIDILSILFS